MSEPIVRKIDFFGGLHGNFLELVVNCWIDQNPYYTDQSQFNQIGSCHLKHKHKDYVPITKCGHFSYYGMCFDQDDLVIRIVPAQDDLLIAITNSFLRAGDQVLDINDLETDTYVKMSRLPKLTQFLDVLVTNHGRSDAYPRALLRKYFYAMFEDHDHGLGMFTNWLSCRRFHEFKFRCFFDSADFLSALGDISKFVSIDFSVDCKLIDLHKQFLEKNQGYHSEIKCKKILHSILQRQSVPLHLNIIEEAYLNYKISKIFNVYEIDLLEKKQYPLNTAVLSEKFLK